MLAPGAGNGWPARGRRSIIRGSAGPCREGNLRTVMNLATAESSEDQGMVRLTSETQTPSVRTEPDVCQPINRAFRC
jgi:hypothetical protein